MPEGSTILVIGSGPIVIGQACEFDYSGTQACKALRALGYRVVLLNSNPATIMTDETVADATFVEPITVEHAEAVIALEKPDAVLSTVGGQTGLNLAMQLAEAGVLERHGCKLIGADPETIHVAEDREAFRVAMKEVGVPVCEGGIAHTMEEAEALLETFGLPSIIRPSFTMGGAGGGVVHTLEDFREVVAEGLRLSPVTSVLVEPSLLGWKEYELEVMRDQADNAIIVCTIENFDPMGVHTGDSITVAPAMTLTDREYQNLRDLALTAIRRVGVATGGANVQFAVNPANGDVVCIELNPRVSRSSALASKATGFPIAKIAAQLAVGGTLDGIDNDITKVTPACFEPVLDYVIVKIPRWNFEKFGPKADPRLGSAMRAVGEVMGIGRTFIEALVKAIDSLEGGWPVTSGWSEQELRHKLAVATPDRLAAVFEALHRGWTPEAVHRVTAIDPWFLDQVDRLVTLERSVRGARVEDLDRDRLDVLKRAGLSDARIATLLGVPRAEVAAHRKGLGLQRVYKRVDTCAAEFESFTPYLYSTFEDEDEAGSSESDRVIILGNGPNRIGQGLEFDYCCVHAAYAVAEAGLTSVMVNCNPETVSTDYDTSDKLYFEPCTVEHVQAIIRREQPRGVILQFGGQTPLKIAHEVTAPVVGSSPEAIDLCEDRERFNQLLTRLGVKQPPGWVARDASEARLVAKRLGYPLLVRPSYVLGGRSMTICYDDADLDLALLDAVYSSNARAVLLDRFLDGAVEYDVDAICDGERVYIGGIIEHIEEAGVHSGDSFGVIPARVLSDAHRAALVDITTRVALELEVVGCMNVQFAIHEGEIYVLEVNPRASRTVPFVAKATGLPLAKIATRVSLGETLQHIAPVPAHRPGLVFVKAPVFPWRKLPGSDGVLGPEMRSTGEVMGVGVTFGEAYAKACASAGMALPTSGRVLFSTRNRLKGELPPIAAALVEMGFTLAGTEGTAQYLREQGFDCITVPRVRDDGPSMVDRILGGEIQLVLNQPRGRTNREDEGRMRMAGLRHGVPVLTGLSAARAAVEAIAYLRREAPAVRSLQGMGPGAFTPA
ncbi:MAG: carbamoyl-phosphate synthase large subunit [Alphaproteobacteria bacterium]|nr:carbamoyl-phosphate synthase large subunit [Alphaproteobacteria bacterium]